MRKRKTERGGGTGIIGFFIGSARTFPLSAFFREAFPVIFLTCFLLFTDEMTFLFSTHLGKVCAIYLIILYTFIEKFHGMLVCFLFILYYQIFDDRLTITTTTTTTTMRAGGGDEGNNSNNNNDDNTNSNKGSKEIPFVSKDVIRIIGTGN